MEKSEVFEQDSDICVLHGILLSFFNQHKPKECFSSDDSLEENKILVLANSINKFIFSHCGPITSKEKLESQLNLSRKWHCSVFFMILRSEGIACEEADTYYQVIANNPFHISWKFYVVLSWHCDWSEFFLQCSVQLPSDILANILRKLLSTSFSSDLKSYSWHLILQAVIWKLCYPSELAPNENSVLNRFDFAFTCSKGLATPEMGPASSLLIHSYISVLNHLSANQESDCRSVMLIVLHGVKTLCRMLCNGYLLQSEQMDVLVKLDSCLAFITKEKLSGVIEKDLKSFLYNKLKANYKTVSLKADINYLLFVLNNYLEDIKVRMPSIDQLQSSELSNALTAFHGVNNLFHTVCPLSKVKMLQNCDTHLMNFLKEIIIFEYPFASRAATLLLSLPSNDFEDMIQTLENSISVMVPSECYKELICAIVKVPSELKTRYLQLLHRLLAKSPPMYNECIKHILEDYEFNNSFLLPDFQFQLTELNKKIMTFEKAENAILPLMLQDPGTVLNSVVFQVIEKGTEGLPLIEALKHVPFVCNYCDKDSVPLLLNEIMKYLDKPVLTAYETKNFLVLIQALLKMRAETIFSFDKFLRICIIPHLENTKNEKLLFLFDCLNVILEAFADEGSFYIMSGATFLSLVSCLGNLLQITIEDGDGNLKESILVSFNFLNKNTNLYQKELKGTPFKKLVQKYNPLVRLYICKFLNIDAETSDIYAWDSMWTWFCLFENANLLDFQKELRTLSYPDVINILICLHQHYTKEEWIHSIKLLEKFFSVIPDKTAFIESSMMFNGDIHLHAIIQALMDCFIGLSKESSCNMLYASSCLTNSVMVLLENYKVEVEQLVEMFLRFSYLISTISNAPTFSTLLITIHKEIATRCKNDLRYFKLILLGGINLLPESEEKSIVMNNLS